MNIDCSQIGGEDSGYQQMSPMAPSIEYFDDDSDYASGDSYPSSILSSDYNFKYENGRRYFARRQVKYPFPNDDKEWNRLELTHHMWTLLLAGKLFKAPVGPEPLRILDLATGTGLWAIEVADQYPDSQVIGNDIAPTNPPWMPPNLDFHIEDIEDDWVFPPNSFDLIHIRGMAGFIKDWPRLISQCFTALKPGGYIELQDLSKPFQCNDGTCDENSILQKWVQLWEEGNIRSGREWLSVSANIKSIVNTAGFVDAVGEMGMIPTGGWHPDANLKELGMCMLKHWVEGAEGITLDMFTRVLGWKKTDVDELLVKIRKDLLNPKIHTFTTAWLLYARKPLVTKTLL
ncbi:uncharacterized protein H6S33_011613 [Morchella sextelata]|uniref:uncharacterized protein n=1 Tax=Morchella sextelata TaxID=1174677 RepID=UPI001D054523|nr:uncharacterized protein H6S33_011613 [Morchella sextelata]KAH0611186.1 hypothetical protein H6S33_011613 [Morchella sextelata]